MKTIAICLMLTVAVMGCATTHQPGAPPILQEMPPQATPADDGPSALGIIGTILLLPVIIPIYALVGLLAVGAASRGHGVSCSGKSWADGTKWKSSCY